jgi:hypothetical protein
VTRPRAFTLALLTFILGDLALVSFGLGLGYALLIYAACRAKELLEGI